MSEQKNAKVEETTSSENTWGSKLVWGVFFIAMGSIVLLANFDIMTIDTSSLWRLWPVVIIVAGLSILSLRGWVGRIVYVVAALGVAALVWMTLTGGGGVHTGHAKDRYSISRSDEAVTRAEVKIDAGAGVVTVGSHMGQGLVSGMLESDAMQVRQSSLVSGETQKIELSLERSGLWWPGKATNKLDVQLSRRLPMALVIDAGASSLDVDTSKVMLESLEIDSGASAIKVKLGDKMAHSRVTIDSGVSSVNVSVPKGVGVRLELEGGLSSRSLPEGYEEVAKDTYQSRGYGDAEKKMTLRVDLGLSRFTLATY